jgi:CheY-like chemotaxis protein
MDKVDNIWIVDDDEIYIFVMHKLIQKTNICENVSSFLNVEDAVNALRRMVIYKQDLPSIILLDINMPDQDGWQFMEEFIKLKPLIDKKIQIFMASSSINIEDKNKAKSYADIADFLSKPISPDTLLKISLYA